MFLLGRPMLRGSVNFMEGYVVFLILNACLKKVSSVETSIFCSEMPWDFARDPKKGRGKFPGTNKWDP